MNERRKKKAGFIFTKWSESKRVMFISRAGFKIAEIHW